MDLSTFDPSLFDPSVLLAPFLLFMLIATVIGWIAMMGGSLQFSLWLALNSPPGYLRSLLMAMMIIAINIAVFGGFFLLVGLQPWYVIACYQMMLQVLLIMLLARCNPISAFMVAVGHGVFSMVGTVALLLVVFLTCGSAIQGSIRQGDQLAGQEDFIPPRAPLQVINKYAQ